MTTNDLVGKKIVYRLPFQSAQQEAVIVSVESFQNLYGQHGFDQAVLDNGDRVALESCYSTCSLESAR